MKHCDSKSILDTDLYLFSMSYAYMKLYPEAEGTLLFIDRGEIDYTEDFISNLKEQIKELGQLSLTDIELEQAHQKTKLWIPKFYWEWLKSFRFNPDVIKLELVDGVTKSGKQRKVLNLEVTEKNYKLVLYEVHLLSMISSLLHKTLGHTVDMEKYVAKLDEKINLSNQEGLYFGDMGTRRRFSYEVHDAVIKRLSERAKYLTGTSNIYLAIKYNLPVLGTMAHSWIQFHAGQYGYRNANYMMMEAWEKVFDSQLGCALTDTLTTRVFFDNFSRKHANLYSSLRHDSGDPYSFVENAISRYKELGIDPLSKSIIFSDGLNMSEFSKIAQYCKGKVKSVSAGIGTDLTSDVKDFGFEPTKIVMKMVQSRMNSNKSWVNCIKISDDLGKITGQSEEVELACKILKINLPK